MKRKGAQPPAVVENDYRSSVVDMVRVPFASVDLPYSVKRRRSFRKLVAFIWRAMFRSLLGGMIAGAIIGLGFGVFHLLNNGVHVPDLGDLMLANGSGVFMDTSLGAMIGGVTGVLGGVLAGIVGGVVRKDLTKVTPGS